MRNVVPVLHFVAGALAGKDPAAWRDDPVAWAYTLRDAIALAGPAVAVSHLDPALEVDALRAALGVGDDWVDRVLDATPLAAVAPARAGVELVRTLAGLPLGGAAVAAAVTAPATVAAGLAEELGVDAPDRDELTDLVADALAALADAYCLAGATRLYVVEQPAGVAFLGAADRDRALGPLRKAAAHARVELGTEADLAVVPAETTAAQLRGGTA